MYGAREEVSWAAASREAVTFFDLKGVVESLLEGLQIPTSTSARERCHPTSAGAPEPMPAPKNWAVWKRWRRK